MATPKTCGAFCEVSELIGTTALIAHLNDRGAAAFNGKFCRIEAFDPHVRRYVVKVRCGERRAQERRFVDSQGRRDDIM